MDEVEGVEMGMIKVREKGEQSSSPLVLCKALPSLEASVVSVWQEGRSLDTSVITNEPPKTF